MKHILINLKILITFLLAFIKKLKLILWVFAAFIAFNTIKLALIGLLIKDPMLANYQPFKYLFINEVLTPKERQYYYRLGLDKDYQTYR